MPIDPVNGQPGILLGLIKGVFRKEGFYLFIQGAFTTQGQNQGGQVNSIISGSFHDSDCLKVYIKAKEVCP